MRAMPHSREFKFVYIPCDASDAIEEWTLVQPEGKEVECLLDRLKEHFASASPVTSNARQKEALLTQLTEDVRERLSQETLDAAASILMVETVQLLPMTPENGYVAVNLYVDDKGAIKGLPINKRASEITACCGNPVEVRGDAFVARIFDDEDEFRRLDFDISEMSSSARWVIDARLYNERKRERESPEAVLRQIESNAKAETRAEMLSSAEAERQKGNECFKLGKYRESIKHYDEAIRLKPNMAVAYSNRAMAYLKLEDFLEAEVDADKALELDHMNVKALYRRGCAREGMGLKEEAIGDFNRVLLYEPKNKDASNRLNALLKRS